MRYFDEYDHQWPSPRLRAIYERVLADMRRPDDSEALRTRRWNDFQRRVRFNPGDVYRHRTHGWEYIPIHPFADEPDTLARVGLKPEDCWAVDAWWGIDGDATLFESMAKPGDEPRLFAKATDHPDGSVVLVAHLIQPCVTRTAFEEAMSHFADAGFPRDPRFRLKPFDPPVVI